MNKSRPFEFLKEFIYKKNLEYDLDKDSNYDIPENVIIMHRILKTCCHLG